MNNLDHAKAILHNRLVTYLSSGGMSFAEFRSQNQLFVSAMNFVSDDQAACFEEAGEVFTAIESAQKGAGIQAREEILKKLNSE